MFLHNRQQQKEKALSSCVYKIVYDYKNGMQYIDAAAAYGEEGVREIRNASRGFAELNDYNVDTILQVLLKTPGSAALEIGLELYSHDELLPQLAGAVLLARFGLISQPDLLFDRATDPDDQSMGLEYLALTGLQYMDKGTVDAFLIGVLNERPCSFLRCCVACFLLRMRQSRNSADILLKCLQDVEFPAVSAAFVTLHSFGYEEAVPLALELLARGIPEDESRQVIACLTPR
jgi:hypothetical protein